MINSSWKLTLFVFLLSASYSKAQPSVIAGPGQLDFGPTPVFQVKYLLVELTNQTDALVYFLQPAINSPAFYGYPQTWAIPAGEAVEMYVSFQPDNDTLYEATLSLNIYTAFGIDTLQIPLSGEGVILKPSNLTAMFENSTVDLNWFPPGASPNQLAFGSSEPVSSIGTSNGIYEFAHRFTADDLMPYSGKRLTAVEFYIYDNNANLTLNIYTDEFAEVPVISVYVTNPVSDSYNQVILPDTLIVSELEFLWIAYETDQQDILFIAGVDGGPGVAGSGDMLRINGSDWTTLTEYNYNHNWCIRGLLSDDLAMNSGIIANVTRNTAELLGYNVYRNSEQLNPDMITETNFSDSIAEGETVEYGITAVFAFGESQPALILVSQPVLLNMPDGWEFSSTYLAHNIHISADVIQTGLTLSPGDMLGAFYNDNGIEKCAGAIQWNGTDALLTAWGNDPNTPEKDGFDFNESINWKLYMQQNGTTVGIVATYYHSMPHYDGLFKMLGLSMIESIEAGTVGIEFAYVQSQNLIIYPNPSNGNVTLGGLASGGQVVVYDNSGRIVLNKVSGHSILQLNINRPGLYMVEIRGQQVTERKKLIIR